MITKREVLETIIEYSCCFNINCNDCPFKEDTDCNLLMSLVKLGAKEMLKTLPREFDKTKVLTCVTADQAKLGQTGIFADTLLSLEIHCKDGSYNPKKLIKVKDISCKHRFVKEDGTVYCLFYPIDEAEECLT